MSTDAPVPEGCVRLAGGVRLRAMSRSLGWVSLVVALGACRCGERAPEPTPAPAASADRSGAQPKVRSDLKLSARCDKLLASADVERVCGAGSIQVREGDGWQYECELRFSVGEDKTRHLSLRVTNELDSVSATRALERGATEAQENKKFAKLEGVGSAGHTYYRTFGSGEGFRRMPVLEAVDGPFALKLEAPYHPKSTPVCAAEKLPELAKVVIVRLKNLDSGGQGKSEPANAAPTAEGPAQGEPAEGESAEEEPGEEEPGEEEPGEEEPAEEEAAE